MAAWRDVLIATAAASALLAASGCDTRKRLDAPQGDTPVDTGRASTHVRLMSDANGGPVGIHALRPTTDGGYVAVGYLDEDAWIFKTSGEGSIEWQERVSANGGYHGTNRFNDVQIDTDGGYVAVGRVVDRATAIKFRVDGSIAWQWWATYGPPEPPNYYLQKSTDAVAIAVKVGGTGFIVSGAVGRVTSRSRDRLVGGTWAVELDANGLQGEYIDPTTIGYDPGPPIFRANSIMGIGSWSENTGGAIEALSTWSDRRWPSDPMSYGLWFAGSSADGQLLVGRAQIYLDPHYDHHRLWMRTFGPGAFHALQQVARETLDGTRVRHLLLAGEMADALLVCELDADTGAVVWATRLSAAYSPGGTRWSTNAIQATADGGAVLAASTLRAPAVLKLDRAGAIEWQYEYVPIGTGRQLDRGEALAIQVRTDGGYRVAGHQNMEHNAYTSPSLLYFQQYATVFDVDASGLLSVNEKAGWAQVAATASAEIIALEPMEYQRDFHSFDDFVGPRDADEIPFASPTNVIVETASGPNGVLPPPPVGSNSPGNSFFWGGVPGASGFIIFRSDDGITFRRDNTTQQYDFDLNAVGFFKVAAFNGAGYSEYSAVVGPLGTGTPTTPSPMRRLTVFNSPGGGVITSAPAGINCGTVCSAEFVNGTDVTLTLLDTGQLHFSSWMGCESPAGQQCSVHMDRDITVTARYAEPN
jgi:hypothetical protein